MIVECRALLAAHMLPMRKLRGVQGNVQNGTVWTMGTGLVRGHVLKQEGGWFGSSGTYGVRFVTITSAIHARVFAVAQWFRSLQEPTFSAGREPRQGFWPHFGPIAANVE